MTALALTAPSPGTRPITNEDPHVFRLPEPHVLSSGHLLATLSNSTLHIVNR